MSRSPFINSSSFFFSSSSHSKEAHNRSNTHFQCGYGKIIWRIELKINKNLEISDIQANKKCVVKINSVASLLPSLFFPFIYSLFTYRFQKRINKTKRTERIEKKTGHRKNQNNASEMKESKENQSIKIIQMCV